MGTGAVDWTYGWMSLTAAQWSAALSPMAPNALPYTSLLKGTNFSAKIYIYGGNEWDGTDAGVNQLGSGFLLATIDVSEWLRPEANDNHSWGTSNCENKSSGCNEGSAIWFPFAAGDPEGYRYFFVQTEFSSRTQSTVSNKGYTAIMLNSTNSCALTFVLGGDPDTPLDVGS